MTFDTATLEAWILEGIPLQAYDFIIEDRGGWNQVPALRGAPVSIPYTNGAYTVGRKWVDAAVFSIDVTVLDSNADGTVTHAQGRFGHLEENLQKLKLALRKPRLLLLERRLADGTDLEANVELLSATPFRQRAFTAYRGRLVFTNSAGSWREVPAQQLPAPGHGTSLVVGGDAEVGDSVWTINATASETFTITVRGENRLTIGPVNNGDTIVIDNGRRTVTVNGAPADAITQVRRAGWIDLQPAESNNWQVQPDADCTVQVDWFNRRY